MSRMYNRFLGRHSFSRAIPGHELNEDDFHKLLVKFFEGYINPESSTDVIDWTCIDIAETHFGGYLRHPRLFSVFLETIFRLFEEYHVTDNVLVQQWLMEYTRRRIRSYGLVLNGGVHFYYLGQGNESRFRMIKVPFYERFMRRCTIQTLLSKPFIYQDFQFMKRLLRYTVPLMFQCNNLQYILGELFRHFEGDSVMSEAVFYRVICCSNLRHRRLKLLLMAVDFVVQKRRKRAFSWNSIKSLNLLFEAIPDAWITRGEVYRFLKLVILNAIGDGVESVIEDFCQSFVALFPESAKPRQPRTLQHLARCEIRKSLFLSGKLPHGVHKLRYPKLLKNYILLQTEEQGFHPGYNAASTNKHRVALRLEEPPTEETQSEENFSN